MKTLIYFLFPLLIFYTFSIFYKSDSSFNQDLGRHLKLGEIIVDTGIVPINNLFSYTYPDFKFINHHFLFEVFIYLWSKVLNLQTLLIFKICVVLVSVMLLLSTIKKSNYPLLLPLGYIFLHALRGRTDLRPEIFSFFFTSLTIFILEKFVEKKTIKLIFLLPLIQLIWVNTHIYFFVGLILQFIYIIDFYLRKEYQKFRILFLIGLTSLSLSLLNPNFINGFLYPLRIFSNYGYSVAENQSIFLLESIGFHDNNFLFVKISFLIVCFSLLLSLPRGAFIFRNFVICIVGLVLSLVSIRSFPFLFFLSFPVVLQNFNIHSFNKKTISLTVFMTVLLLVESILYLSGYYYKNNDSRDKPNLILKEDVSGAVDFMLSNSLPQPIYNNFDIGSYIIYKGYPKYRVFVDGRPESYPASFFQDTYIPSQNDPEIFKQLDLKYNFQTIIFSITDQTPWGRSFLNSIVKNTEWSTIYLDHFMIILVKNNNLQPLNLQSISLNNLNPNDYHYNESIPYAQMSLFFISTNNLNSAKAFAKKAWGLSPNSNITKSLLLYTLDKPQNLGDQQLINRLNEPKDLNIWW